MRSNVLLIIVLYLILLDMTHFCLPKDLIELLPVKRKIKKKKKGKLVDEQKKERKRPQYFSREVENVKMKRMKNKRMTQLYVMNCSVKNGTNKIAGKIYRSISKCKN